MPTKHLGTSGLDREIFTTWSAPFLEGAAGGSSWLTLGFVHGASMVFADFSKDGAGGKPLVGAGAMP